LKEAAATIDELLATEILRVTAFVAADAAVDSALARLVTAARTPSATDGGLDVASILQEGNDVRALCRKHDSLSASRASSTRPAWQAGAHLLTFEL
jgi:Arc/MetJ family transcription regulator